MAFVSSANLFWRARPDGRKALTLFLLLVLTGAGSAGAQIADTLPTDSVYADTVDHTARFLEARAEQSVIVPVLPRVGVEGPRVPLSRIVITRDSIDWRIARTVSDLLQRVPGVYLWRGGWLGRPQYPNYRGRGPASVEYIVDGMPYPPVGLDTTAVDPALFSLTMIDRIEIERWPGFLRVYLFTSQNDRLAAHSWVGIASGDRDISSYQGGLEKKFRNGIGLSLSAEYFDAPTGSGASSGSNIITYWLQTSYVPSERFGVRLQSLRRSVDRDPFIRFIGDTIGSALKGSRHDDQLRVFYQPSPRAPKLDLILGRTGWEGSGVEQSVTHAGGYASWRSPRLHLGVSAFHHSRWTPVDVMGRAGFAAPGGITISGEVGYQRHEGDRSSRWVGARAGVQLPLGVTVAGSARLGERVATPSILDDTAQTLRSLGATVLWEEDFAGLEAGVTRTGAFSPRAYQPFLLVDSIRPLGETEWLTLRARITPLTWLTLESWYSDPLGVTVDGIPPTHSYSTATIRSKFLRTFPSGIFDLKLQLGVESWGTGIIGTDASGTPITVGGATYFRGLLQIQLGSLILFWDRMNLTGTNRAFVPEYDQAQAGSVFGARWEFRN